MPIPVVKGGKGNTGAAEVTVTQAKTRIVFETDGVIFDFLPEDVPDYLRSGRQIVILSSDNTRLLSARPIGGSYEVMLDRFASREDEPPTPKAVDARSGISKAGKKYKIDAHLEFTAVFSIVSPKRWAGYPLVYNLFYAFSQYKGENITQISGNGSQKVEEFLIATGMDFTKDDIPFSENVLPYLEKLLVSRGRRIIAQLSPEGYITNITPAPVDDDDEATLEDAAAVLATAKPQAEPTPAEQLGFAFPKEKKEVAAPAANPLVDTLKAMAAGGDENAKNMLRSLGIEVA